MLTNKSRKLKARRSNGILARRRISRKKSVRSRGHSIVNDFVIGTALILILSAVISSGFIWKQLATGELEGVKISEQSILEAAKNKYIELSSNPNIDKTEAAKAVAIQYNLAYFALGRGRFENTKCVEVLELEAISIPGALNSDCVIDDGIVTGSSGKSDYNKRVVYSNGMTVWAGVPPNIDTIPVFDPAKDFSHTLFMFLVCLIAGIFITLKLTERITVPLKRISGITKEFASGVLTNRLEETDYIEINELINDFNKMADAMQSLYSSLEQKAAQRSEKLAEALKEISTTQAMMVHSEKMKSLGELVAGIMHEINNPINFIYGNLTHLKNYSNDLISLVDKFSEFESELSEEHRIKLEQLKTEIDYNFLKDDLPALIDSCHEGTDRAKNIILDLKNFSRLEETAITSVDLAKEIDTTLNILHNKFKYKITVHKEYEENMPKIEAFGGQLNQVFMNILDNAAYAVDEKEKGDVWIRLKTTNKYAVIEIEDNGKGMDKQTREKIFNPFFTTKPVGKGSGLGLSITYKVIKAHKGNIEVYSTPGTGTKFVITLPIVAEREKKNVEEEK